MAEVTGLRNVALPYPVYGVPWGVVYPLLDADGDFVTGATTPDAEVSKNGDTFADCTNESTEIATASGMYYLLLTSTEMTADVVAIIAKSATAGMKTTPIVLYPAKLVTLRSGTVAANAADGTTLQLDSGASAVDDYYNGCLLVGTIDSVIEARVISDYVGSTKVCTVSPAFNTAPDNNDTFVVYNPLGRQFSQSDLSAIGAAAISTTTAQLGVNAVQAGGTAWASGAITSAVFASGAITATTIAADAITDAKVASDVTIASVTGSVGSVTGAVGSVTGSVGSVTGAVGSVTGNVGGNVVGSVGSVVGSVGSVTGLTAANLDVAVSTRLAAASYTAPDNASITAIKAKTDSLTFSVAGEINANIRYVNGIAVTGSGTTMDPWGPA